ncbi:MAG: nucleoside triphosphate pyrophosphohydrolase [Candidatus Cloacimonetes bacterium]|nr:nucleoside triphosphate pyrophosphohydrolase [Candidatus Cloacimonadota bacterium]
MVNQREQFEKVIHDLRDKDNGCPWDLKQSHSSLKKYFLEEVYEFLDEVDNNDLDAMEDELGDVLLQIYLHAQLLKEETQNRINIETIAQKICEKMVRRHPHVFDKDNHDKDTNLSESWQKIKDAEGRKKSKLDSHRKGQPLTQADKLFKFVKKEGFRFESFQDSLQKVQEEIQEVNEVAHLGKKSPKLKEELGDLLLATCSSISELGFSSEELLLSAIQKFSKRYEAMDVSITKDEKSMKDLDYQDKLSYWGQAKAQVD